MGISFDNLKDSLYDEISNVKSIEKMPKDFTENFLKLVANVNYMLIEEKRNFYGYFLLQMSREIRYDIATPTAVNFKLSKYIIYFNPYIFLNLTEQQMKSTIKHEIHHILSFHLNRGRKLKKKYSTLAINMAMDIVVNQHIDYLPPYATTLEQINIKYSLKMQPYMTMEYYTDEIQLALSLLQEKEESEEDDSKEDNVEKEYVAKRTHDLWEESTEVDEETLKDFTEKLARLSDKGSNPAYLQEMLKGLAGTKSEIPWNMYLKRIMGTLESDKKRTVSRRSRRQPNRLDLRGELRGHTARITLAIDISGSISEEEFNGAVKEVFNIIKTYKHEITLIECDSEIRQVYKVKSINNIRKRSSSGGGTKFTPVFNYVNNTNTNILIYFTDGKGEENLRVTPRGYKTLWVISGRGDKLSLNEPFGIVKKLKPVDIKEDTVDKLDVIGDGFSMNNQEPIY
ncbi:VWA-like domain-containing protein [Clostridium sp. CS001]|uniref:vWA domain-containing protein n=1 Tax=Clostridium sp. CS001 TaxID=2880648 RepID=UPI001CF12647|nr:VWA-like domain-containing protein [Clostridium sp. CS001]MCB2290533.1 VWA-like domain-containing protein [Clostridium sp. CS001]